MEELALNERGISDTTRGLDISPPRVMAQLRKGCAAELWSHYGLQAATALALVALWITGTWWAYVDRLPAEQQAEDKTQLSSSFTGQALHGSARITAAARAAVQRSSASLQMPANQIFVGCLLLSEGGKPLESNQSKNYPIGYLHVDFAEASTEKGRICVFMM